MRARSGNTLMEVGVAHADLAHRSSALCLCAFVTLCHKEGLHQPVMIRSVIGVVKHRIRINTGCGNQRSLLTCPAVHYKSIPLYFRHLTGLAIPLLICRQRKSRAKGETISCMKYTHQKNGRIHVLISRIFFSLPFWQDKWQDKVLGSSWVDRVFGGPA
jgi:hypothetical protein